MIDQHSEQIAQALAEKIQLRKTTLGRVVAGRLLEQFPEINTSLRLEEQYSPVERLASVSVERLSELVRAALIFGVPSVIDDEFRWAIGYLPQQGVRFEHQEALVRWLFEEIRRLHLSAEEHALSIQIEQYLHERVSRIYRRS
jgi:hypothetical protein